MEAHALEGYREGAPYDSGQRGSSGSEEGDFVKIYRDDVAYDDGTKRAQTQKEEPVAASFTFTLPGKGIPKTGREDEQAPSVPEERSTISGHTADTTAVFYMKQSGQLDRRDVPDNWKGVSSASSKQETGKPKGELVEKVILPRSKQTAENVSSEESKRIAEAEIYVHDAIEYVTYQQPSDKSPSGFVIRDDVLTGNGPTGTSADPTSQMIRTNEVSCILRGPRYHQDARYQDHKLYKHKCNQ